MPLLDKVVRGVIDRTKRIVVYGGHGVGKTTWASRFPDAIVIDTEKGSANVNCDRVEISDPREVAAAIIEATESEYRTIVIDSIDWLESAIEHGLEEEGFKTDFGKGAVETARRLQKILSLLDKAIEKGKTVVLVSHFTVRKATDHTGAEWDQFTLKLSKRCCAYVEEWADYIVYAKFESFVRTEEKDFGRTKSVASTTGKRVGLTETHPSYVSKSRGGVAGKFDLTAEITKPFVS